MSRTVRSGGPANRAADRPVGALANESSTTVLIVFGTTENHTRKLAEFAVARLAEEGHQVTLHNAADAHKGIDPSQFGVVFIAASLHWRRYQNSVIEFAQRHREALNGSRSAFISASLSAADVEQPDDFPLEDCVRAFVQETLWTPAATHHAAGGIGHTAYDYFKSLAATLIARGRGDRLDVSQDYDLTDYDALASFVRGFVRETPNRTNA